MVVVVVGGAYVLISVPKCKATGDATEEDGIQLVRDGIRYVTARGLYRHTFI